jgi:hypothetical protein
MEGGSFGPTLTPASIGGRRRRSMKKLRLVKKKTVRRMLARQGLKMRGGGPQPALASETSSDPAPVGSGGVSGGRRRKSHRKSHRRSKSLFGMRF